MNLRRWFHEHSLKLLAIRDTPEAIAGGVAIGVFFGFMPLFGVKTILAIFVAWLTRSNIIAAVVAGALHDVILPFMPVIYRWEYQVGYWLLSDPHHWPKRLGEIHWGDFSWRNWKTLFSGVGKPLVLGGAVCSTPWALVTFFVTKVIVARHQRRKQAAHPLQK
jgi:uncharacterized protein (DUF2062 family)